MKTIKKTLPVLSLENAKIGGLYRFGDGRQRVINIYKITDEYAKEHQLYSLNRVKTIDFNDNEHDFALCE